VLSQYARAPLPWLGALALALLICGLAVIYGAAVQFRRRIGPLRHIAWAGIPGVVLTCLPFLFGLDGLAFIAGNFAAAVLMCITAWDYWLGRHESPLPIAGVTLLYALTGVSFAVCAAVLIADGSLVLGRAPNSWAEDLNLIMCIVGMTGIGALSLSLNQSRLASRHRRDAQTDALTGLLNRRALFERHGEADLPERTAVILFDLDQFKSINDRHGHAVGDAVLRRFTAALTENMRPIDTGARMGGEEFAAVLPRLTKVLSLVKEAAAAKAGALGLSPYDALLDEYEPGGRAADIDVLFADLADDELTLGHQSH